MKDLDETDVAIVDVLKKNARLSTREISKISQIPPATVYKRMKRMEKEGVIEGYTVRLNQEKLGRKTVAYILIRTNPGADYYDIHDEIIKNEGIEDIASLTGQFDTLVKVRVHDTDELSNVIFKIRNIPAVAHTETIISLNVKRKK
ncbi:MAG: Lrp/AsnC family transcriptional regulator [Candidatus Micrarchaeota archaeon]|nr:Lrp/AsnC family transcriptional regulator [Candidatus Micrarchaeota archaeon]